MKPQKVKRVFSKLHKKKETRETKIQILVSPACCLSIMPPLCTCCCSRWSLSSASDSQTFQLTEGPPLLLSLGRGRASQPGAGSCAICSSISYNHVVFLWRICPNLQFYFQKWNYFMKAHLSHQNINSLREGTCLCCCCFSLLDP